MLKGSSPGEMVKRAALASFLLAATSVAGALSSPMANAAMSSHVSHAMGWATAANAYRGSKATDCVALSNSTVFVDDTVVRAKWSLTADKFGFTNLCAAVSIRN